MATTTQTVRDEFSALYPLAVHIIAKRVHAQLGSAGIDNRDVREERIANALGHCWQLFARYRPDRADAKDCLAYCARTGAKLSHKPFASTRKRGQVDAMDYAKPAPDDLADCVIDENTQHRLDDRAQDEKTTLDKLPAQLRPIAVLLMAGVSRVQIARRRNCSPATITRRCEAIADCLQGKAVAS